ncbi:hypothetical protein H5410_001276 [Solanum commersonii]|uniref:Uncharacterized protein n=1 Tax=Solanum commersonii TaxID=4109 RepID=A0A9J6AZN4_SOLCO|nr:hypothetical protein H5410_001276 [Solanum commersonii]
MHELKSNIWVRLVDLDDIKKEVMDFYKGLTGIAKPILPGVNIQVNLVISLCDNNAHLVKENRWEAFVDDVVLWADGSF